MVITIDTKARTIKVEETVKVSELIAFLDNMHLKDYSIYVESKYQISIRDFNTTGIDNMLLRQPD